MLKATQKKNELTKKAAKAPKKKQKKVLNGESQSHSQSNESSEEIPEEDEPLGGTNEGADHADGMAGNANNTEEFEENNTGGQVST